MTYPHYKSATHCRLKHDNCEKNNMAQRKRATRYVTPAGIAVYPYLTEPDTKFDPEGAFKVTLRLAPSGEISTTKGETKGSIEQFLADMAEASYNKAVADEAKSAAADARKPKKIKQADLPYSLDDDTGEVLINFKLRASGKTRAGEVFTQKPALFTDTGSPFTGDAIWGGSELMVNFEVIPFYTALIGAGISLRLKAAQVLTLVSSSGGGTADTYGFAAEGSDEESDEESDEKAFTDASAFDDQGDF